jgi:hypothetical protein
LPDAGASWAELLKNATTLEAGRSGACGIRGDFQAFEKVGVDVRRL